MLVHPTLPVVYWFFPQVFQQGKVQRSNLLQASVRWDFLLCAILCFINFLFRHSRPIDLTCNLRCTNKLDVCERWNFSCLPMSSGLIYCRKKSLQICCVWCRRRHAIFHLERRWTSSKKSKLNCWSKNPLNDWGFISEPVIPRVCIKFNRIFSHPSLNFICF